MKAIQGSKASFLHRDTERPEVLEVRRTLLQRILLVIWLAGLPAILMGSIDAFLQGRRLFSILYIATYLVFLALTLPLNRFSTRFKSMVLIVSLFLVALAILMRLGLSGVGLQLMIGFCFLVSLLFGLRGALFAILVSLCAMIIVAAGMSTGFIAVYPEHMLTSTRVVPWVITLVVFVMIVSLTVIAPEILKRRIEESLDLAETRRRELEFANRRLREEIRGHRETEAALRTSEYRYRTLFDCADDAIFILSGGTIVDCNEATRRLFGGSKEDIVGRSPTDLSPETQPTGEPSRALAFRIQEGVSEQGKPERFEWVHRRLDGTLFHAEVSVNLLELGEDVHLQAVVRDITEKKAAERALHESEFRFRTFYNSNPEGVVLLDLDGKVLDANKAAIALSGYPVAELVNRPFSVFFAEADRGVAEQAITSIRQGVSLSGSVEILFLRKDSTPLPVSIKGWCITDEESRPVALGVFMRDLTREKHLTEEKAALEKQLMQSQRIEAIGTLAGGIAHDFNNILGGIIGYTELALLEEGDRRQGKKTAYLNRVLDAGKRAKALVQQILNFSRPNDAHVGTIEVTPLVKESVKLMRSTLPKNIEIVEDIAAQNDLILGDPTQVHQVIMNLCTNAYHAMRRTGGALRLSVKNVVLHAPKEGMSLRVPPGEFLLLAVSDTGCGIDPQISERIFDPYFTTKQGIEGSGLGLSVTLGIVKGHNGLIEMESRVGEGTRFDVYFPVSRSEVSEEEGQGVALPAGRKERVLVVDDEPFFLDVVGESLDHLGYRVRACGSSSRALEVFKAHPEGFDLLVTDQSMPGMTGVQLIAEIRKLNGRLPVILCTGYSETVTEQSAEHYGITRFLMKPVNARELAEAVRASLDGHPGP